MSATPDPDHPSVPPRPAGPPPAAVWWADNALRRVDTAIEKVDQAYRDAKLAGVNFDTYARRLDESAVVDPPGVESHAVHATHIEAMRAYSAMACALADSIGQTLAGPAPASDAN